MRNIIATINRIDSRSELIEKLANASTSSIILGENAEQKHDFYIMKLRLKEDCSDILNIGVISEGHGLKPSFLINNELKLVYIGLNREVDVINYESGTLVKQIKGDSLFYEMLCIQESSRIVIIQELGINCISYFGELLWSYSSDLIIDYRLLREKIELVTEDKTVILSLSNGLKL